jgi:ribosomal protein L21
MTRPITPALSQARREKTLALMLNPPRPVVERARGHREWMTPLAVRRGRV